MLRPVRYFDLPASGTFVFLNEAAERYGLQRHVIRLQRPPPRGSGRWLVPIRLEGMWNAVADDHGQSAFRRLMSQEVINLAKEDRECTLVIDITGEGFPNADHVLNHMTSVLSDVQIPKEQILILSSCVNASERYRDWCQRRSAPELMTAKSTNLQILYFMGSYFQTSSSQNCLKDLLDAEEIMLFERKRSKIFLSLNFSPRVNRYALALEIVRAGLETRGFFSFFGPHANNGPADPPPSVPEAKLWLGQCGFQATEAELEELHARCPFQLTGDLGLDRGTFAYSIQPSQHYLESYISLVTESDHSGYSGLRLTEKCLKPLAHAHPMIVIGMAGLLHEVRKLGFRTFGEIIDESYDLIEDPGERLRAALDQAIAAAKWTEAEARARYRAVWPSLRHNFYHARFGLRELMIQEIASLSG